VATAVVWFRRDLRLSDNPALVQAVSEADDVVGVFCLDPALLRPAGAPRVAFLVRSLRALDASMGGTLVVRRGNPVDVVPALAAEVDAASVHLAEDFGPYGRRRDDDVAAALVEAGIPCVRTGSSYAVPPGTIRTKAGGPYKVFTPFWRSWSAHGWPDPVGRPAEIPWRPAPGDGIPDEPDVGDVQLPEAGEDAAGQRVDAFLHGGVDAYADQRDDPGADATSRLSPYLRWGTIHARQLLARLGSSAGERTFAKELCWREFYADVLFHRPASSRESMDAATGAMPWDRGPGADALFDAWATGRTGYPIVDAGMRQLLAEGWVHNRVRMIVASFLVKDLHLEWQRGARHFMQHLVDGDLASNQHGWQWVAGTGTDAAPFFRVFNPTAQGKRFDREGTYVRRHVPELRGVDDRWVHEPHRRPGGSPAGYPAPVVDHAEEREEALQRYAAARAGMIP
jgi:deoxyribodipyrimidine photo-lyase